MNNRRDFLKKMMAGTAAAVAAPSLLAADAIAKEAKDSTGVALNGD